MKNNYQSVSYAPSKNNFPFIAILITCLALLAMFIILICADISNHLHQIAYLATFCVMLILFSTYICSRIFARHIQRLNEAMEEIIKGNYGVQINEIPHGKIGVLTKNFNLMLSNIRCYKNSMEQKVQDRTNDLEIAKVKAKAASDAKSEFLRNMSHEFRTPLHGMINMASFGISDIEKGSVNTESMKNYFSKIIKVTHRLTELVDAVLNISKMENGSEEFDMEPCDIAEVLEIVLIENKALCKAKDIELVIEKPDFDTKIICHRGKIIQVITYLIDNSLLFSPANQSIYLAAKRNETCITISLYNPAINIPAEELETIFGKFCQSKRTKTGSGATGLGLAICKGIIHGHQGEIWAENNQNGGSTFWFTIPLGITQGKKIVAPEIL